LEMCRKTITVPHVGIHGLKIMFAKPRFVTVLHLFTWPPLITFRLFIVFRVEIA